MKLQLFLMATSFSYLMILLEDHLPGPLEHWASQLYKLQSNLFNTDTKGTEPNLLFALQRGPY